MADRMTPTAQRRPGREPRRHLLQHDQAVTERPASSAQRRPGREPRRHRTSRCGSSAAPAEPAQRRPGREPRRHTCRSSTHPDPVSSAGSLNEGRGVNPGDTMGGTQDGRRRPTRIQPLNEGRGVNPGDTCGKSAFVRIPTVGELAQRRPGREPRRHLVSRGSALFRSAAELGAQRRPGREPRRHPAPMPEPPTPADAQRRPGREPRRHITARIPPATPPTLNEGRGVNPGDTARAPFGGFRASREPSLNEGRGVNPGDTSSAVRFDRKRLHAGGRSTKAGA